MGVGNILFNTYHAAGECRRQVNNLTHFVKKFNILEFHDHIWNHHEKYIEKVYKHISSISSLIREIAHTTSEM